MDIVSIAILSVCLLLPFCLIMAAIAIVSYQIKFRSAIKYLKDYKANQLERQIGAKPSIALNIFIFVAMGILFFLGFVMIAIIAKYLNIPWYPFR